MKKIYVVLLLLILTPLLFLLKTNVTFAQTQSASIRDVKDLVSEQENNSKQDYSPQNLNLGTNPDVPVNLSTYTQSVFIEITSAASCLLSGVDPIRPDKPCLGFDPNTRKIGYVENNGGALGMMGGLIAFTYNIPASSGYYVRYLADNFGITQNASAVFVDPDICVDNPSLCNENSSSNWGLGTGNGFNGLTPLLGVWTAMRNLVYLLFVLVFIVLGLGIMFRIQIDPRAVLSIQNQLPKVVIALVLVTFSYAIAGFLVDMMYLSLFLIISIFQAPGLETATTLATNPINATGGLGGVSGIAFDASKGVATTMTSLFDGTYGSFFKGMINMVFGFLSGAGAAGAGIGGTIGSIIPGPGTVVGLVVGGLIGSAVGGITTQFGYSPGPEPFTIVVGAIAWLIIMIALMSALFRLWFTLLKTYVFILINITFAPIWIAFGLLPGSSLTFGNWIRSLVSNLAAFPLVLILFSLGRTLQNGFANSGPNAFVPPYVGDPGDMSVFGSLIGMGMILLAPEAVNMTKAALKAPESKFTSSIGRSIGVGQGVVGKFTGGAKNALWHTNPYTNESSRFKAGVKAGAGAALGKLPGATGIKNAFDRVLPRRDAQGNRKDANENRRRAQQEAENNGTPPGDGSTNP